MTLLSTIKRAATLAGDIPPASAVGFPDAKIALMVELARIEAEEIVRRFDWSALLRETTFTTIAAVGQTGALPTDFLRMPFKAEMRPTNRTWSISGPTDAVAWDRLVDFPSGSLLSNWRLFGGALQLLPAPPAGQTVRFIYISKAMFRPSSGPDKATWDADTDTCLVPEDLIALGVVWRWRRAQGLDYAEDLATAEAQVARVAGQDGGGRAVMVRGGRRSHAALAYPGVLG